MPRSIYHLDGPGEIPHLDMLLDIPRLNGIQWVAGAGKAALTDPCWFDMYKKMQLTFTDRIKLKYMYSNLPFFFRLNH